MKRANQKDDDREHVLVYSTEPKAPRTLKEDPAAPYELRPKVRVERKGRGGKTVTVLFSLPAHQTLLAELAAYLKKQLGSGGTSLVREGEGIVEIQGDHQAKILDSVRSFKWPR